MITTAIKCDRCALFVNFGQGLCAARDHEPAEVVRSTNSSAVAIYPNWRPTVDEMRAEGAECGPDAKLYRHKWWRRAMFRIAAMFLNAGGKHDHYRSCLSG